MTVYVLTNQIKQACNSYNWVKNLLKIPRNNSKDVIGTQVTIFGITIDKKNFTARLPDEKLGKAVKTTSRVLAEQLVTLLNI